jgi:poly(A) polymerase Pap1
MLSFFLYILRSKDPSEQFQTLFKHLYHLVIFWAKRRLIYSHVFGYLGGYSWRLLLIYILLREKGNYLEHFFKELGKYYNLNSEQEIVIALSNESRDQFLKHFERKVGKQIESGFEKLNKKRLLIITPTPTYQNSTRNVCRSTLERILFEMNRAQTQNLIQLCEPYPFFTSYTSYLRVTMESNEENYFLKWKGYVLSRIVHLIERFEQIHKNLVIVPNPREFKQTNDFCVSYYIGIIVKQPDQVLNKQEIVSEMQNIINEFIQTVYEQIQLVEVTKRSRAILQKEELERSFDLSIKFIKISKLPKD